MHLTHKKQEISITKTRITWQLLPPVPPLFFLKARVN